jgi:hypothetical protein
VFTYHSLVTDVGLVQHSALNADPNLTIDRLDDFIPFDSILVRDLAERLKRSGCRAVVCDISPLGIRVAKEAGIPSILIENFTWDWIYFDLLDAETARNPGSQLLSRIRYYISYLSDVFLSVDVHIRTEPARDSGTPFIKLPPISRVPRKTPESIRKLLDVDDEYRLVLISNGGVRENIPFLDQMKHHRYIFFLMPGTTVNKRTRNTLQLRHDSEFYHPDLVNAVDAVIGKLGYSTIAEVYYARVPFGYITRPGYREPEVLENYVDAVMESIPISMDEYFDGEWLHRLHILISMRRSGFREQNGAGPAAAIIIDAAEQNLKSPESYTRQLMFPPAVECKTA